MWEDVEGKVRRGGGDPAVPASLPLLPPCPAPAACPPCPPLSLKCTVLPEPLQILLPLPDHCSLPSVWGTPTVLQTLRWVLEDRGPVTHAAFLHDAGQSPSWTLIWGLVNASHALDATHHEDRGHSCLFISCYYILTSQHKVQIQQMLVEK